MVSYIGWRFKANRFELTGDGNQQLPTAQIAIVIPRGERRKYSRVSRPVPTAKTPTVVSTKRKQLYEEANAFLGPENCCKRECSNQFLVSKLRETHRDLMDPDRNQRQRKDFLSTFVVESQERKPHFEVLGVPVCGTFMRTLAGGISTGLCNSLLGTRKAPAGQTSETRRNDSDGLATKEVFILAYLDAISDEEGDRMPNENIVVLPQQTKREVYQKYRVWEVNKGRQPSSEQFFVNVWNASRSHITCRTYSKFAICDMCAAHREQMEFATTYLQKQEIQREKQRHYAFVKSARALYYQIRDRACANPSAVMSLIIDGAAQDKFAIPYFAERTKSSSSGIPLMSGIVGVLNHGARKQPGGAYLYTVPPNQECGSNVFVSCIHWTLHHERKRLQQLGLALPETLHIQADNCSRENKNRFSHGYLEVLVAKGVFRKVTIDYLPKGHTHEDIDQLFSVLGNRVKIARRVNTPDHMRSLFAETYNPRPIVNGLKTTTNIRALLEPDLLPASRTSGFTTYHHFLIERNEAGEVGVRVKEWPHKEDDPYLHLHRDGSHGGFLREGKAAHVDFQDLGPMKRVPLPKVAADSFKLLLRHVESRINSPADFNFLQSWVVELQTPGSDEPDWVFGDDCPEDNGQFVDSSDGSDESVQGEDDYPTVADQPLLNQAYDLDDIVAVRPASFEDGNFWLGQVVGFEQAADDGPIVLLSLRWLVPSGGGANKVTVKKWCEYQGGLGQAHVDSVLVRLTDGLTSGRQIRVEDQKKISVQVAQVQESV